MSGKSQVCWFVSVLCLGAAGLVAAEAPELGMTELVPVAGETALPQPRPQDHLVLLRSGATDVRRITRDAARSATEDALRLQGLTPNDRGYYVVHFAPGVTPEIARDCLAEAGVQVVGHVPRNAYLVRGRGRAALALADRPECDLSTALHPLDRVEPRLARHMNDLQSADGAPAHFALNVVTFPDEDQARIGRALTDLGVTVRGYCPDRGLGAVYRIRCPGPTIAWIAAIPGVQWIEQWQRERVCTDYATGSGSSGTDILNIDDLASTYALNGSGMVVGHADTGLDIGENTTSLHRDFLDQAGTSTRLALARPWALRSSEPLWLDTYPGSEGALGGTTYYREEWQWTAGARSGVVRAVRWELVKTDDTPSGDIVCRLYKTSVPAPNAMPGSPEATSVNAIRAEDLATAAPQGYTFYFDPAPAVNDGEQWYVVIDLSGVTNFSKVRSILDGAGDGAHYAYDQTETSWTICCASQAWSCEVYDELDWSDISGHGTHTLGAIGGNGREYLHFGTLPRYVGPAPQAAFVHQSLEDSSGGLGGLPVGLWPLFEEAHDNGALIHFNGWSAAAQGTYTARCMQVDEFCWNHEDFLPIFPAGNTGRDGRWLEPVDLVGWRFHSHTQQTSYYTYEHPSACYVRSIVLNLCRTSDAEGAITVYLAYPSGNPVSPFSFGTVDIADLNIGAPQGWLEAMRPVEFNDTTVWLEPGSYLVAMQRNWTSGEGPRGVYIGCDTEIPPSPPAETDGTQNITYDVNVVQLAAADGVIDEGTIEAPATAKNCLAVGATETDRDGNPGTFDERYSSDYYSPPISGESGINNTVGMAAFSSRGPTGDGRIKPDLVAPGTCIASCRSQEIVPLLSDDVEGGAGSFTVGADGLWGRFSTSGALAHSGSYRWVGRDYSGAPATTGYLTYNANIDLTAQYHATAGETRSFYLWFWATYFLSGTGDSACLELSWNGGSSWSDQSGGEYYWRVENASLPYGGWERATVRVPWPWTNQLRFRFRYDSNGDTNYGGVYLDDFTVWLPNDSSALLSCLEAAGWDSDNTAYELRSGTSVAAALTAGVAALVREYYVEKKGIDPSAALIKATMINGAVDISPGQYGTGSAQETDTRPDISQGFGRVDAKGCLYRSPPGNAGYVMADAGADSAFSAVGQKRVIEIGVPPFGGYIEQPIRATLVWTDRPASLYAASCLVNDLDLKVEHISPGSGLPDETYYGNGNPAGDFTNTVEHVDIPVPVTGGTYHATVTCSALPYGGSQPWALVLSGGFTDGYPTPVVIAGLRAWRTREGEAALEWEAADGVELAGYRVSRAVDSGGPWREISDRLVLPADGRCRFIDRDAQPGRRCQYRVEAIDLAGAPCASATAAAPAGR